MATEQLVYRECAAPGCDCPAAFESDLCPGHHAAREAEQQLADVREELRIVLAQRQDYRAYWTQARALLEQAAADIEMDNGEGAASYIHAFLASLKPKE